MLQAEWRLRPLGIIGPLTAKLLQRYYFCVLHTNLSIKISREVVAESYITITEMKNGAANCHYGIKFVYLQFRIEKM